ncbi:siphovirus ReqiPepy6 Gp37-like family protein [Actinomadura sp. 3N508]|uniref:siphovirus ReqiPepy6 Gp37-like family protein n=1 Tax=Actinomadura sp. 3N508 TaxID=3375153 RepID=UPI0037AA797B
MIRLLVTDQDLAVQGDPVTTWTSLDITSKFNEPASGTLVVPASNEVLAQLQPGARLVVIRDGQVWCAGPMEVPQQGDRNATSGPGPITVNVTDDLAKIVGNLTYPDPGLPADSASQPLERAFSATGTETILRTLVSENCGPTALAARQIPTLALGAVAGVGTAATFRTRFEPLGDAMRTVAAIDGLGFRTRQSGGQVLFEVYQPVDLTGTARISEGLGNLTSLSYKLTAPTVTTAIVGGGGEGTDRVIVVVTDTAAEADWWRIEQFVDRRDVADDSAGELTAAGQEALATGAGSVELSTVIRDTEDLAAGRDFGLGDRVTVQLPTGAQVADIVREIHLTATPRGGEQVTSVVGTAEASTDRTTVGAVRELARRVGRLEAR